MTNTSSRFDLQKVRFWEPTIISALKAFPNSILIDVKGFSVDSAANRLREAIYALLNDIVPPGQTLSSIEGWKTTLSQISFRVSVKGLETAQKRRPPSASVIRTDLTPTITLNPSTYHPKVITAICLLKSLNLYPSPVLLPYHAKKELDFSKLETTFNVSFTEHENQWLLL